MNTAWLVLAQMELRPGEVGSGMVTGGWEFVTAAYVLTLLGLALYASSLWVRRPKE